MGNLSASTGLQNRYPKARQFARSPVLFASIQLGKGLQGFILNASEGGVCVQTAREIVGDEPLDLRFQSVRPGAWVNARGRIVWKNESNTVAGLQFIDADKEIAGEVRNWLHFGESLQELRGDWWPDSQPAHRPIALASAVEDPAPIVLPARPSALIEMPAPPSAAATLPDYSTFETDEEPSLAESATPSLADSQAQPDSVSRAPEAAEPVVRFPSPIRNQRHSYEYIRPSSGQEKHREKFVIAGIAAGAGVLLLLGWSVFGHKRQPSLGTSAVVPASPLSVSQPNMPSVVTPPKPVPATHSASDVPVVPPDSSHPATSRSISKAVASPSPVAAQTRASIPATAAVTPSASGLVLQIAAMSEEGNANRLADSLKSGHFPAFVSRRDGDRFYRVLVGPFASEAPLREAAGNLKKSGYDSIEKHLSP